MRVYEAPAQCVLPVGTRWAGLLLAKELRLYPGLRANVRVPRPLARVCLPLGSLVEKERREREGRRAQEGPGLVLPPRWLPAWGPIHASMQAWLLESTRSKSSPGFPLKSGCPVCLWVCVSLCHTHTRTHAHTLAGHLSQ